MSWLKIHLCRKPKQNIEGGVAAVSLYIDETESDTVAENNTSLVSILVDMSCVAPVPRSRERSQVAAPLGFSSYP